MSEDITLSPPEKSTKSKNNGILIVIAILLALIFITQIYTIVDTHQQRQIVEERAIQMSEVANSIKLLSILQDDLAADLFEDYQDDAYDNPRVERIAEQQLIATEYQLLSAQVLGIQNQAIIDLLALQFELPEPEMVEDSDK